MGDFSDSPPPKMTIKKKGNKYLSKYLNGHSHLSKDIFSPQKGTFFSSENTY